MSPVISCAAFQHTIAMSSGIQHIGGGKAKGVHGAIRHFTAPMSAVINEGSMMRACCGSMASARMLAASRRANKGGLKTQDHLPATYETDHPSVRRNGGRSVLKIRVFTTHSRGFRIGNRITMPLCSESPWLRPVAPVAIYHAAPIGNDTHVNRAARAVAGDPRACCSTATMC